jgi:signal transduction histidine kinase
LIKQQNTMPKWRRTWAKLWLPSLSNAMRGQRPGTARRLFRAHAIGITLIVVLWGGLALGMYWDHETQARQARIETANLANVLSEQVNRILREADQLARMIEWEVRKDGMHLPLPDYVKAGAIKLDVFFRISVVDRNGKLTASTLPEFTPINVRDRTYFQTQIDGHGDPLYISEPLAGRVSGRTAIRLSRRITLPDGSFGGIVAISLDPLYFTNFYKELVIGKAGQIAIIGTYDRIFRARRHDGETEIDSRPNLSQESRIYQAMQIMPGGVVLSRGQNNDRPRLYGYDKLDDYPLTVMVGFSEAEIMAPYAARRNFMIALGMLITLLICAAEARRVGLLRRLYNMVATEKTIKRQEQQKNDRLNNMFKAIPDGVLILTDTGNIERGNQVTAHLLGLTADALDHMSTADFAALFFRNDRSDGRQQKINRLNHDLLHAGDANSPKYVTVSIESSDVLVFEFHIRHSGGGFSGGVAVIRDVTAQQQLDRMRSDFISTAAHELRTPMAGILGFTELLKAGRITSAQHEDVYDLLHERARQLNNVLNELLDLARLEARADKDFQYERINVCDLCREVVAADPVFATRVGMMLVCEEAWLLGDRPQLMLALRNLLENAIKYSPSGAEVQLAAHHSGNGRRVSIKVRDEGIGMTPEQRNRAFEKFYRADKSGAIPGTGLGLALVREIVMLHGGTIQLTSQPERGTTAAINLAIE